MVSRKPRYAAGSLIGPGWSRCHLSSSICRRSRSPSRARFFGASSYTSRSKPSQKSATGTPVPGRASSSMKRSRLLATCSRCRGARSIIARSSSDLLLQQVGRVKPATYEECIGGLHPPHESDLHQSAATPALAIWASCSALTPETPTAPITWPSTRIGTPPSSMPLSIGTERKAVRPPLMVSS
ncbi:hypothetical protein D3C78_700980 [compost metagenome]